MALSCPYSDETAHINTEDLFFVEKKAVLPEVPGQFTGTFTGKCFSSGCTVHKNDLCGRLRWDENHQHGPVGTALKNNSDLCCYLLSHKI